MVSKRREGSRNTADKKRLKAENPRRNPAGGGKSSGKSSAGKKKSGDAATVVLIITAVILLILVILMLDGRIVERISPLVRNGLVGNTEAPVIERIENIPVPVEEPVVEIGVPEQHETAPPEDTPEETPESPEAGHATARIFFVKVNGEGNISIKSVLRNVPSSGSPLTESINALLDGPGAAELSNDILSLVPEDSRLIGARVDGGTAFLDFNEQFRFNALGIEGYRAQVEQIVYTATEFSTVDKVQFLIEGQRIEFLGGEGFWVGGPLGREDF